MNKVYGFEGEVKAKFGEMTYKLFADVFTTSQSFPTLRQWISADRRCSTIIHPPHFRLTTFKSQI
jgi:hypothetical protein